jgi:hypothetical protein
MRTGFATVLVLLGCLLAGPAVAAYVVVDEVTDRDNYVEAVTPLADDPDVQAEVADQITARLNEKLPAAAQPVVDEKVRGFVASDEFRAGWQRVNEEAHPQVLALLRGEDGAVSVENDAVVLDLGVLAADMKARFAAEGVPFADQIPDVTGTVQVVSGPTVRQAVPAFDLLEKLSVALPIAAVVLIALGLALSDRRAQTLVVTGFGLAVVMLLVMLARWLLRGVVTNDSSQPELAGPFYDAVTGPMTTVLWVVCGIGGLFILVGAIVSRMGSTKR